MKESYHCPFDAFIDIVGGKWKMLILWRLNIHEYLRFSEMKSIAEGASTKVLSAQLKDLEREGLLKRISYPEVPPRVEYHITEKGRSLWKILKEIQGWSIELLRDNGHEIEDYILEEFKMVEEREDL